MFTVETISNWLGLCFGTFGIGLCKTFPTLLPVAPSAFTPMQTIHEMRGHRWAIRWYTSGFL